MDVFTFATIVYEQRIDTYPVEQIFVQHTSNDAKDAGDAKASKNGNQ